MRCGSISDGAWLIKGPARLSRVQRGSVRVRHGSVQGAAWLNTGCGMAQLIGAALVS